jgi:DeoR/GlpR family transcriptional regulator of sugar metabolism
MDKKARIGRAAAGIIESGDSIILDSGSTVTEIAKNLEDKRDLQIITNALNIGLLLGAHSSFVVMVTGGEFKAPTLSLTGEKAAAFFSQIHVKKLFLATGGISFDVGLTYPGLSDLPVKSAMIEAAEETYLVADSTKIGRMAFAALGALDRIQYLITDGGISDKDLKEFESRGIKVILAE